MKRSIYTEAVLTVIALLLAIVAVRLLTIPETTAQAQTSFAGVQFSTFISQGGDHRLLAVDTRRVSRR